MRERPKTYKSSPRQENIFFANMNICHASTDPPVTKTRLYGLLLGCRSPLDGEPFRTTFFDNFKSKKLGNLRRLFWFPSSLSQSIGRGRMSREGALDLRESRERRDKIYNNTEYSHTKKIILLLCLSFFQKCARIPLKYLIFCWRKKTFLGGG